MIIGKDNNLNFSNNNFNTRMNTIKENLIIITSYEQPQSINTMQHSNILDKTEMKEKSFNMLQDRYNKGLISMEEFNKKCNELGKK